MKVGAIVQARTRSQRLPGKVMLDLGGKPIIDWVVHRLRASALLNQVIIATPEGSQDDELSAHCESLGVVVVRGSETDVLARYVKASRVHGLDGVVRVTSDCPLIDPRLVDDVVGAWIADPAVDFVANTLDRHYPRGLDASLTRAQALYESHDRATSDSDREHVTLYVREPANGYHHRSITGSVNMSGHRWTVDEPEDLEMLRALVAGADLWSKTSWWHAIKYLWDHPDISAINAQVQQKATC